MKPTVYLLMLGAFPGILSSASGDLVADDRLNRPVSVAVCGPRLPVLLGNLERQTGVRLACEQALSHRVLVVVAKERPLREVMEGIAGFSNSGRGKCTWVAERRGGHARYRLTEDRASREHGGLLRLRRDQGFAQRFELARSAARMSPDELVRLRRTAPRLAQKPPRGMMPMIEEVPGPILREVFRGQVVDLPYGQLTERQQVHVREQLKNVKFTLGKGDDIGPDQVTLQYDGSRDFRSSRFVLRLSGAPNRPGLYASVRCTAQGGITNPNLLDPWVTPLDERPDWLEDGLVREREAANARGLRPPTGRDPDLDRRVTIRRLIPHRRPDGQIGTRFRLLPECLAQLAEESRLSLVAHYDPCWSDYYVRETPVTLQADLANVTVRDALNKLCARFGVTWDKQDAWLRIRSEPAIYAEMDRLPLVPRYLDLPPVQRQ